MWCPSALRAWAMAIALVFRAAQAGIKTRLAFAF
jgi:hypothetical protein